MFNSYQTNTLTYDPARCIGCGVCAAVCPHAVFAMQRRVAQVVAPAACMECDACQRNCPADAIAVDSGVGCAASMFQAALFRRKEVTCG